MDSTQPQRKKLTPEERAQRRLEAIRKNRQCKRLPVDATKEEIRNAHLVKMATKRIMRERYHQMFKDDHERFKEWEKAQEEKRQHVL